ncbi:GNAT family N-acetyltransferase [Parashewanella curva]|uniref:GNAT family N-acetyltransferase n=1 Tax=Parashewanella curva TaxID=2338552 RepID=A0A3L8PWH1_9GAMM|nr:GNAT family N-acetyltransferase [Parashewanella curva]RLV59706.1 GNAT family N-acetyltransferase [Parashewanella curva]
MEYIIRAITAEDDLTVKSIIHAVGAEFGAIGEGFGPSDDEVYAMSSHYKTEYQSQYFVAELNGKVIGGSGIASFHHSNETCELKKLFILPDARGLGVGKGLTKACLNFAKEQGFRECYLDTLSNMESAIALYKKMGFVQLEQPHIDSTHNGCDIWMLKQL